MLQVPASGTSGTRAYIGFGWTEAEAAGHPRLLKRLVELDLLLEMRSSQGPDGGGLEGVEGTSGSSSQR